MTNNVGLIIIGWNEGFKDIKVSKQNNQWFKSIPLGKLKDRIIYLSKLHNIESKVITEEYTSQTSYLDDDAISTEHN